jgi:hypothetical protein
LRIRQASWNAAMQLIYSLCTHDLVIAVFVPILLMIAGACGKTLVEGGVWKWDNLFLGIELTLAALSAALTQVFTLMQRAVRASNTSILNPPKAPSPETFGVVSLLMVTTFVLFVVLLVLHQQMQRPGVSAADRDFYLGRVSNGIGLVLLFSFVLLFTWM